MAPLTQYIIDGRDIETNIAKTFGSYEARITTITSFMETSVDISVQNFVDISLTEWTKIIKIVDKPLNIRVPGTRKNSKRKHKSFYNSISIHYKTATNRTICAKMFRTGFHITGCKDFEECIAAADVMTQVIALVHGTNVFVTSGSIQMVNIVLNLRRILKLEEMYNSLTDSSLNCIYDREVYCGLRVKIPSNDRTCTAIFFPSGKAILAGIRACDDIARIYQSIHHQIH